MQLLQGYPLDEYLKRKATPAIPQVLRLAREAAAGLAAAHRIGLVHRDVKPANLWLEAPHGRVKVLDFGLAKPVDAELEVTGSGVVVGTPAYMSPEQARALKVDARADLFSLGAVLYRLCTGRLPFDGPTTMAVLTALAADAPRPVRELNPAVPEPLADLIHQLLAKNPADRPQTADEVVRRLRAMVEGQAVLTALPVGGSPAVSVAIPVTAVPATNPFEDLDLTLADPTPLPRAMPPSKREPGRRWVWVTAAAVLLAAAGVAVIVATNKGRVETKHELSDGAARATRDPASKPTAPALRVGKPLAPAADPDRAAAVWVLSVGGKVRVNGEERDTSAVADLPGDRFTVSYVSLYGRPVADADLENLKGLRWLQALNLEGTGVTDAGYAHLKELTGLYHLRLKGTRVTDAALVHVKKLTGLRFFTVAGTAVTDAGVAHIGNCNELEDLGLDGTRVTDAGLARLKGLTKLRVLWLDDTAVTDAGLASLKGLTSLKDLNVRRTRVTAKGLAEFQAAVPHCTIWWDGGTIEPKK
jgi:hypothetical protein